MANSNILTRKQLEKMSAIQLIDFAMKIPENMISSQNELFNENKKFYEKLTDIQSKFDKLASDNEILQSKIIVAEKKTNTLQENLSSNNSKITDLERSFHKLEQYFRRECVKIAGIPRDIHVILQDVVIKLLNKIGMNLTKNDLVAYHRLANSNRTIIKVLNRKHAELIMNNKSKLQGMNFSDVSNTSDKIDEEVSVNSPQNTHRRNPRIYINYSLCPHCWVLYGKVKKMMQEGLIHKFWISKGGIIKIREFADLTPFPVSHKNDLNLEY